MLCSRNNLHRTATQGEYRTYNLGLLISHKSLQFENLFSSCFQVTLASYKRCLIVIRLSREIFTTSFLWPCVYVTHCQPLADADCLYVVGRSSIAQHALLIQQLQSQTYISPGSCSVSAALQIHREQQCACLLALLAVQHCRGINSAHLGITTAERTESAKDDIHGGRWCGRQDPLQRLHCARSQAGGL